MEIIGAGFGRTGTMSLQAALEQIGYAPCYHFSDLFKNPDHIAAWQAAADGEAVDWQALLGDYKAGLDYPIAGFYQELMAAFPDAKVLLSIRDPQSWYDSTIETIYIGAAIPPWLARILPPFRGLTHMIKTAVWDHNFQGRFEDRAYAIQRFNDHIEEVRQYVPADKLLVFNVKEGWEPLCTFLNVPVPDTPFPHVNDRKTTQRMYLMARVVPVLLILAILAGLIWLAITLF